MKLDIGVEATFYAAEVELAFLRGDKARPSSAALRCYPVDIVLDHLDELWLCQVKRLP